MTRPHGPILRIYPAGPLKARNISSNHVFTPGDLNFGRGCLAHPKKRVGQNFPTFAVPVQKAGQGESHMPSLFRKSAPRLRDVQVNFQRSAIQDVYETVGLTPSTFHFHLDRKDAYVRRISGQGFHMFLVFGRLLTWTYMCGTRYRPIQSHLI